MCLGTITPLQFGILYFIILFPMIMYGFSYRVVFRSNTVHDGKNLSIIDSESTSNDRKIKTNK